MLKSISLGGKYVWGERVVELDGILSSFAVSARDIATGEQVRVPTGELRPLNKERGLAVDLILQVDWDEAKRKAEVLLPLLDKSRVRRQDLQEASKALNKSPRQVHRLLRKFRQRPQVSTLVTPAVGRRVGVRLLDESVERILTHCIQRYYLTPERCSVAHLAYRVEHLCRRLNKPAPSINTIHRRVARLDQFEVIARRHGRKTARERLTPHPGALSPSRPLEVVQIDHTEVDLMVVSDDEHREVLGRPWLTVAVDVYSRCIVGIHLSLDHPSALSVALCIAHTVLPKEPWLKQHGLAVRWEMYGRPMKIHTDNAQEFRGTAMAQGCEELGIILEHRPVGLPNWGGHIERLIGTLMRWFHCLPGTTFSNPREKGKHYSSENRACLTLSEARTWLVTQICNRYHQTIHRGLGMTPAQAWEQGFAANKGLVQELVTDPLAVLVSFLPTVRRLVRRTGVEVFGLRYWHDALTDQVGRREHAPVYYDPRDVSAVYLRGSDGTVIRVPVVGKPVGQMSLFEFRRQRKVKLHAARSHIPVQIVDYGVIAGDAVLASAQRKTRKARLQQAREKERKRGAEPLPNKTPHSPEESVAMGEFNPWAQLHDLPVEQWGDESHH